MESTSAFTLIYIWWTHAQGKTDTRVMRYMRVETQVQGWGADIHLCYELYAGSDAYTGVGCKRRPV